MCRSQSQASHDHFLLEKNQEIAFYGRGPPLKNRPESSFFSKKPP